MAVHVARAFDLCVWNRTVGRAQGFAREHGCRAAPIPRAAVQEAEVVIACLPSSEEVFAILEGQNRAAAGLRSGAIFLDCTSGSPEGAAGRGAARE
jgi:3-hydroxyisobutyrate dehydrogenase-like beta-hydroxyacid dehydrogenase